MVDEVGVGGEHPVREPIVAHELPDVLGGVELRAFGREHHERDVVRNHETGREVPSGLVDDEHGVLAGATSVAISARCRFIASVLQAGRTSAAPLPSLGQIAPKM